ncbi:uncharacterized protein LOC104889969 isoform X2 [Beta vulgaris subsp. vulgaris]|uniref:uncharacterized protein LOC104889969 isoform X2 n=1 Tax=Beta vulgaris subsp. vulgaris TaxID=3555 RepID=UPI00203747B2|nr:uncharacterized protein LOC104889969 isoform X2 [Beta vulgaris subsp. vulgaris]
MSKQHPVKRKKEDDSEFSHIPPQHQTVNISSDDTTTSQYLPKKNRALSCFKIIFAPFKCLFTCCATCVFGLVTAIFAICAGATIGAIIWSIVTLLSIIIAIASLPLLLVSFLVTRLLQFIRHGDDYDSAVHFKLFIRAWIYTGMSSLVVILAILYGIAKNNSTLKRAVFMGSPLSNWIVIYFVIFGIYVFNWALSVFIYKFIPIVPLDHSESGLNVPENVLEIIDCFIFWLALSEVYKRVPAFKDDKIFGLYTRKWIEVSIFLLIAYNVIILSTRLIVRLFKFADKRLHSGSNKKSRRYLFTEKMMHLRYLMYCANGLKHNIDFVLTSLMLLLIWVLYFGSHLNEYGTTRAKKLVEIGTWTCVSLLVCAFLWLIKTCLLLSWEASAVYNRLETKIIDGGKQLYFLGIIGRHVHDFFNLQYESTTDPEREMLMCLFFNIFPIGVINIDSHYQSRSDVIDRWVREEEEEEDESNNNTKKLSTKRKKIVNADFLMKKGRPPTMFGLQQGAHYFLKARETLKNEKYTSDIMDKLKSWIDSLEQQAVSNNGKIKKNLMQLIGGGEHNTDDETKENDDWGYFEDQMREYVAIPEEISLEEIEKWMMEVRTIGVWITTFSKVGTREEVIYPNSDLSTKQIINHKTDFDWIDHVQLDVSSLEKEKIRDLKQEIELYLGDPNKFTPGYNCVVMLRTGSNINVTVSFKHNVKLKNGTYFQCYKEKHRLRSEYNDHLQNLVDSKKETQKNRSIDTSNLDDHDISAAS